MVLITFCVELLDFLSRVLSIIQLRLQHSIIYS